MKKTVWSGVALAGAAALVFAISAHANASGGADPAVIDDEHLHPSFTTMGGADVLPTDRTVAHWWGSATNPADGVTYGYNMVGSNPYTCSGSACSTTVETDITPINVVVGGRTFSASDVLQATLTSPMFTTNDYTTTSTVSSNVPPPGIGKTAGGTLSPGNVGVQLEDATMRSQFNRLGSSPYHLNLHPVVHPAITINVPANHGVLLRSGRGVIFADVDVNWWSPQLQGLLGGNTLGYSDPTHLAMFLTNTVMLYSGHDPNNCCIIGYHGASKTAGSGSGNTGSNGNAKVQTYAWNSYIQPGIFNPATGWAIQDIHAISHEVAEWGDDPFVNNTVQPWLTPTAPQYGCTGVLETGDPVVGIGFSMGTNTYAQGPAPNGQQIADGTYHPEDEVFLPWFMRTAPNTISQATQAPSGNIGRYTLMGDLNPYPGFREPATGC
jgi:hypothetical protein